MVCASDPNKTKQSYTASTYSKHICLLLSVGLKYEMLSMDWAPKAGKMSLRQVFITQSSKQAVGKATNIFENEVLKMKQKQVKRNSQCIFHLKAHR